MSSANGEVARKKLAGLREDLAASGGRGVELAEEVDELACQLGECVYSLEECGWQEAASHPSTPIETEE